MLKTDMKEYIVTFVTHKGNTEQKYIFADDRADAIKFISLMYRKRYSALVTAKLSPYNGTRDVVPEVVPNVWRP